MSTLLETEVQVPTTVRCMKCHGTGTYEYHMGARRGTLGNCTRCTPGTGRMSGKDIARYWGWLLNCHRGRASHRLVVEKDGVRSYRDLAPHAEVYVEGRRGDIGDYWDPTLVQDLIPGDLVLIPAIKTGEILVCTVVEVVEK